MNKWKIILISIGLGVIYWIFDSVIDALVFKEGKIVSRIFVSSPHEIYARFLIIGILLLLIYFTSVILKRRQIEKTLHEVEEHLRNVLNNAPITIFAIDKQGVFTLSEGKGLINAGLKPGENVGVSALDLYISLPVIMPTGEVITGADVIRRVLAGETMTGVTQLAGRYFDNQFVPFRDKNDQIVGIIGVATDITERKNAEKTIRESEEKYRLLFHHSPIGVFHYDTQLRITECNERFIEILKSSYERLIGLDMNTLKDKSVLQAIYDAVSGKEGSYEGFYRATTSSAEIWVSMHTAPTSDKNGIIIGGIGIVEDITERKKAEDALRESEENFRKLFESSTDGIFILDMNGNLIDINRTAYERLGYTKEEMLALHIKELDPPEFASRVYERLAEIQKHGSAVFESAHYRKDRTIMPVEVNSRILDYKGQTVYFSVIREITERKKMEEQLSLITHDWEDTFNSITDMVTVHDKDWNIIRANKAAEKILGLPFLEKTKNTKCFKYYHGTEKPPEGCPSCQCLQTGVTATFEIFEPHLNMFVEIRAIPRFDENHNLIGLIHVVRDITNRKKSEEKLSKLLSDLTRAKMEWEITFDTATEFIILVNKDLNIIRCNKSFADYFGIPIKDMIGKKYYDYLPFESEQLEYLKRKIMEEEATEWLEEKTKEGYWFYVSHRPVFDEKGKFLHSVIIATDITILKNSQEELIKSEEELRKRIEELEKFYEMAVGRELKMKELKDEIKRLNAELAKYKKDANSG